MRALGVIGLTILLILVILYQTYVLTEGFAIDSFLGGVMCTKVTAKDRCYGLCQWDDTTGTCGNAPVTPEGPVTPKPTPVPTPEPTPMPTPEPTPMPTPEPTPMPEPMPGPAPAPAARSLIGPGGMRKPVIEPTPAPAPTPVPATRPLIGPGGMRKPVVDPVPVPGTKSILGPGGHGGRRATQILKPAMLGPGGGIGPSYTFPAEEEPESTYAPYKPSATDRKKQRNKLLKDIRKIVHKELADNRPSSSSKAHESCDDSPSIQQGCEMEDNCYNTSRCGNDNGDDDTC